MSADYGHFYEKQQMQINRLSSSPSKSTTGKIKMTAWFHLPPSTPPRPPPHTDLFLYYPPHQKPICICSNREYRSTLSRWITHSLTNHWFIHVPTVIAHTSRNNQYHSSQIIHNPPFISLFLDQTNKEKTMWHTYDQDDQLVNVNAYKRSFKIHPAGHSLICWPVGGHRKPDRFR